MRRVFRRWPAAPWWLALSLTVLVIWRLTQSSPESLSLVPAGRVELTSVSNEVILHVRPMKTADVYRVRLIGLSFENPAATSAWLREQYQGKTLRLELDKRRLDADGICLAYLYSGATFLNADLIRRNLAIYTPYLGDSSRHAKEMKTAEKEAMTGK